MPERIAKVDQVYAGRNIKAGESFHVEQSNVDGLLVIGRIEPVDGDFGYEPKASQSYMTRDMQAKRQPNRKAGAQ